MRKRVKTLCIAIIKKVVEGDCFGLNDQEFKITVMSGEFNFSRSADKVTAFMEWLKQQEKLGLLAIGTVNQLGQGVEGSWTDFYIADSYERGVQRARYELIKRGYDVPALDKLAPVSATFSTPFHIDRVGLVFSRVYTELKGITNDMDKQISTILAQGLVDGKNPRDLARMLVRTITGPDGDLGITDSLGRYIPASRRAEMLARTEIIRAHHIATVQEYKNWGLEGVTVMAEWATAGWNVCPECSKLQGKVFTISQIETMIPAHPNCFLDGQTPIYTSTGWKPIGKIVVGDMVLTHRKRFRKVTHLIQTPKQKPDAVRFSFHGMSNGTLAMTANHPVLVTNSDGSISRWKSADKCTIKDHVKLLANRCKRCGDLIPYFREYCSQTCISKDVTEIQWADPKHRENVSKKNSISMQKQYQFGLRDADTITKKANSKVRNLVKKGKWNHLQTTESRASLKLVTNTPELRKAASERMQSNNPMHDPNVIEKVKESLNNLYELHPEKRLNSRMARHRKSGKMTWIEQRMGSLLDKIGIEYIAQYPILRYNVDFAIPSLRIAIECDGEQWHQDKEKDQIRQQRIEAEGWSVLRYSGAKINQCLSEIEDELCRVVGNHTGEYEFISFPIQKIEHWTVRKARTLYNFSVEEDESYIAKGVAVHNCRCCAIPVDMTGKEKK